MKFEDFYPLAVTLPQGWFSEYDMESICPALEVIPKDGLYVEVGTHMGLSLAFARTVTDPSVIVCGIDIVDKLDRAWFKDKKNCQFINKPSNEVVKDWVEEIDVLLIDGNHTHDGCMDDWKNFSPFVKKGGVVFFHDADETSPGVVEVVNEVDGDGWGDRITYIEKLGGKKTSMVSLRKL